MPATTLSLEILRRNVEQACTAWAQSKCNATATNATATALKTQLALCASSRNAFELLGIVAANVGADRRAQEMLAAGAPRADAPRLRMLVLHQALLADTKLFTTLRPEQTVVLQALRQVTTAQITAVRRHAAKVRAHLGADEQTNPDLQALLA